MDGIIEQKSKKKGKPSQFIYTPDSQNVKPAVVVIGYLMRAMIVCLGTAALSIFFCSAFRLTGLGGWGIFFVSLLFSAVLAFMAVKKKFFLIGGGVLLAGLTVPLLLTGDPIRYLGGSIAAFINGIMDTLAENGYQAPLYVGNLSFGGRTQTQMQVGGIVIFTLLIAIVMTVSILRKVRLLPLLLVGVPVCAAVFTYNFSNSNWGFALLIVVLCAVLVLRHYDVCFKDKRTTFRSAALGGYSGFTAAMLALLVVMIPACTVHSRWKPIGGISEKMEIARAVMSSVLIGDKPDWSGVDSHGKVASLGTRSTEATPRYYSGAKMVEVFSDYKLPIYLKGFVAADYNDEDDRWRCANAKELKEFEELFGEDFEPESYASRFFEFAAPTAGTLPRTRRYDENLSLGFVNTRVSVNVLTTGSNMIFVPSRFDPRTGFLDYPGDREEKGDEKPYGEKVMNYFDGIRTTNWTNFNQSYSTHTFLPVYRDAKYPATVQSKIEAFEVNLDHIRNYYGVNVKTGGNYTLEAYLRDFGVSISDGVIDYNTFRSFTGLSLQAQKAYIEQYVTPYDQYRNYVREQYGTKMTDSQVIPRTALEIVLGYILPDEVEEIEAPEEGTEVIGSLNEKTVSLVTKYYKYGGNVYSAGGLLGMIGQKSKEDFTFFHKTVLGVLEYLKANCSYTLTPVQASKLNSLNPTEKFLSETKEGYCVQFASAATFLLREMGLPVRYVEGFLADTLTLDRDSENRFALYHTTVADRDQHAWIEVWHDTLGWLTYETVPANYDAMYKIYEEIVIRPPEYGPDVDPGDDPGEDDPDEPFETEPETEPPEEEGPDPKEVAKVLCIMAGIGLVIGLAVFLIRREKNRRLDLIEHREGVLYSVRSRELSDGERFEVGRDLSDLVVDAMKAAGMVRGKKEFPAEFGERVDEALEELEDKPELPCRVSDIVPILEALEFGKTVRAEDLTLLADFYEALCAETGARFNPFERYWYCKVKCVV